MIKSCPDSVDVTELQFKLQCRLKVFENDDVSTFPNTNSLLTSASRYGLLFVGTNSKHFQVIQTQNLQTYTPKEKDVTNYPRRNIDLPSCPKHLCVNCDNTIIAVVLEKDQCCVVIFYEVLSFLTQNVKIIKEIRLSSTPNVYVKEINWNPSIPVIFTACKSDGTLGVYELKGDSVDFNELPAASGATCFCWSPKGKQIAVGSKDGKITQYKPDLKAVKVINEPKLGDPRALISLQWVSNYQFIGVYQLFQAEMSSSVVVVDAPKTGEPSYTNYDDICYSGSSRPPQFYLILQQSWNFLMVASGNSSEVGVLGINGDSWTQWIMSDTARAELPLSSDHQETLPVGLAFDISSVTPLPWGESSIPPCPLLCILSHQGVLCSFNVVYLKEGVPSICRPADTIQDTSGLNSFVTTSESNATVAGIVQSKLTQPPVVQLHFGMGSTPHPGNLPVSKDTSLSAQKIMVPFTSHTQSTPLFTGKTDISSNVLFGSHATLTPIKPQQPSEGVSLFGGQTLITPISKGPNVTVPITNALSGQATNINTEKYASIFSSLNSTTLPPSSTVPVKPIVISAAAPTAKPEAAVKPQEMSTAAKVLDVSTSKGTPKSISTPKQEYQIVDPKLKAETSAMLSQMIRDEWMYLEAELKVLINQGRTLKISLGTDEEKVEMITLIESLQEFVKEAVDISVGQSSEIHCLKQNLIQSWAWYEEANSYYNSSKNEAVALLLKLQPLDSVSQKRLKDIEQLTYYIESQLYQTSKTLDEQWGNFQDYAKKTHRVQMPTMEAIFQTMVSQSAILQKQTYVLKDISMLLKKRSFGVSSLLLSIDKAENLADDLKGLRLDAQDILQLQYEKIKNHTKILSNKKANKLRVLLKQREVTHITAVRPQLSSWTINQSPASRIRQSISILGAQMSPVSKTTIARNLDFIQSTPLKVNEAPKPPQVGHGLTFSLRDTGKPSLAVTSNTPPSLSGFVSLAKSGPAISSSQGSAFAPIGFTATSAGTSENSPSFPKTSLSTMPFSFGSTANKTIPSVSQVKPGFSTPSLFGTTASVTATTSGHTINLSGNASSLLKSTSDYTTVKTQSSPATPGFSFSFGSGASATKNAFGVTSSPTSGPTGSNNLFFSSSLSSNSPFLTTSSSSAFNSSNTEVIKSTNVPTISTTSAIIKPLQTPTTASIFGSQQSSFASLSKPTTVPTITTAVSTSTPPRASSGVASIFANLQSVIDKATGSSGATASTTEASKPIPSYGISSGTVTTTTQLLFGTVSSSTSAIKPVFKAITTSNTGSLFGNISKPVEGFTSTSTTPNIFGGSVNSSSTTITPSSKAEALTATSGTPSLLENSEPTETAKYSPSSITSTVITSAVANYESSASPSTTQISIFGSKSTSPSSSTPTYLGGSAAIATSASPSIFSSNATTVVPKSGAGIFDSPTTTSTTVLGGTSTSIFGVPKTTTSTASSVFPTTIQSSSIFGNAVPSITTLATSSSTESNIFGASTPTPTSPTNVFGSGTSDSMFVSSGTTVTTASQASIFGTPSTSTNVLETPETAKNIFGAHTGTSVFIPSTTPTSAFLSPTAATNAFGTPTTSSNIFSSSGSIFGGIPVPIASTSNIFGTPTNTSTTVYGTPTSTSSTNIFGSVAPVSTAPNAFGSTTNAAAPFGSQAGSIFGAPKTTGSIFGQQGSFGHQGAFETTQATTASAIFGQPSSFGSGTLDFGSSTTTSSGNIFGNVASSSSEFGSGFGATPTTNTFGSQATTQAPSTGAFGFGTLSVDGTSSSTGNIFGGTSSSAFGAAQATNPFGKVENKSPFGSASTNIFGNSASDPAKTNIFASPATTASSIFGSSSGTTFGTSTTGGGFGSPSTFASPAFGQPSTFGSNTFGSPQPGSFSGSGASPIAQSGFGAPASFQKPSGFGSPPVFGGSAPPAFGATPSFGGAPAFGSTPTFGTPEKVFGVSQPASSGFAASATQQTAGFGNLASQNTIGFGNLAQQANTQGTAPFSGNTSFSSWR